MRPVSEEKKPILNLAPFSVRARTLMEALAFRDLNKMMRELAALPEEMDVDPVLKRANCTILLQTLLDFAASALIHVEDTHDGDVELQAKAYFTEAIDGQRAFTAERERSEAEQFAEFKKRMRAQMEGAGVEGASAILIDEEGNTTILDNEGPVRDAPSPN